MAEESGSVENATNAEDGEPCSSTRNKPAGQQCGGKKQNNNDGKGQANSAVGGAMSSSDSDAARDDNQVADENEAVPAVVHGDSEMITKGEGDEEEDHAESTPPSTGKESIKNSEDSAIISQRRRRRCPIIDIGQHHTEETKDDESSTRRTPARIIMQRDTAGLISVFRKGASASEVDLHGWSALHWACSIGSVMMTHIVLQEIRAAPSDGMDQIQEIGDHLNAQEHVNGWTPLHLAVVGEHLDVVYLMMEAGCNPSINDKVGDRPLNCVKRSIRRQGKLSKRLRNALLDLSDSESSDDAERNKYQQTKRQQRRRASSRAHRRRIDD